MFSCFGDQYEPEYTEEELAAATATDEESTNNEEDEVIDKNFCSCGHCKPETIEIVISGK
jgi:hypothetical protein